MRTYHSLIAGRPHPGGDPQPVIDPATGAPAALATACDPAGAAEALVAAARAAPAYAGWTQARRGAAIARLVANLRANREGIIAALVTETGKPAACADYDFGMLVTALEFFADAAAQRGPRLIPDPSGAWETRLVDVPVGVVLAVLSWNFPLLNLGYKLGPILATGNAGVIKPSPLTPCATSLAIGCLEGCGFPDGLVSCLLGGRPEVLEALAASPVPRLVTMIGSTAGGVSLMRAAATSVKRYSLELGGNAAVIVLPDADLDLAAREITALKLFNAGQICVAPNRVLADRAIVAPLAERCRTLLEAGAAGIQPVISQRALDRLVGLVGCAVASGARLLTGGARQARSGWHLAPTLLVDVHSGMDLLREEIFGPVLPILAVDGPDEALALANAVDQGLAGYVFSGDPVAAARCAEGLACGSVLVNGVHYAIDLPHGGLKQSGIGCDCSVFALDDYLDVKRITVRRDA
jgi:acyl-CoA reductase-like NAD-dependent aldehyde dehydrogenase